MKKIIGFDLDDTLAVSKSAISPRMADLLAKLLENYQVCVISGGKFEQFQKQVIDQMNVSPELLARFHMMPTCGTRYYTFNVDANEWQTHYKEDFTDEQKQKITQVLEESARKFDLWEANPDGEIIEDRLSQVTYSALGQQASPEKKYAWAEANKVVRKQMRDDVAAKLPEFEVRLGGTTSVDITKIGVDKAYGMKKLMEATGVSKEEILFFGDKLEEGGNDFPVKNLGIDCIAVERWQDTAYALEGIIAVTE